MQSLVTRIDCRTEAAFFNRKLYKCHSRFSASAFDFLVNETIAHTNYEYSMSTTHEHQMIETRSQAKLISGNFSVFGRDSHASLEFTQLNDLRLQLIEQWRICLSNRSLWSSKSSILSFKVWVKRLTWWTLLIKNLNATFKRNSLWVTYFLEILRLEKDSSPSSTHVMSR